MMIIKINELKDIRSPGTVWTNGCFDLLHPGHVNGLKYAKSLGNQLVVGINSNDSVRQLKGSTRPVMHENERAIMVDSIKFVDYVVIFDSIIPSQCIELLMPDIYCKGEEYRNNKIPEVRLVESYGGKVVYIPMWEGISTSTIISRINSKTSLNFK